MHAVDSLLPRRAFLERFGMLYRGPDQRETLSCRIDYRMF